MQLLIPEHVYEIGKILSQAQEDIQIHQVRSKKRIKKTASFVLCFIPSTRSTENNPNKYLSNAIKMNLHVNYLISIIVCIKYAVLRVDLTGALNPT